MEQLIERYVYDVTRRLPDKDREEVSRELKANIYDMMPDPCSNKELEDILYTLGPPASLAEKYRQNPRYLISPAYYDEYIRTLKWALPAIGLILLAVGMVFGAVDSIKDGSMVSLPYMISLIISNGLSFGVSAAFQALLWVTAAFVIAERTGVHKSKEREWRISELPELKPDTRYAIPLSDSIAELVIISVFSVIAFMMCAGLMPAAFMIRIDDKQIDKIFNPVFLAACVPAIGVTAVLGIMECVMKIKDRKWTLPVCAATVTSNLIGVPVAVYMLNRPDMFSQDFLEYISTIEWGSHDLLRFAGQTPANPIILMITVIIIIASLAECGAAIYKTLVNAKLTAR